MPKKEEISTPNLTIRFTGADVDKNGMDVEDLVNALTTMNNLIKATQKANDKSLGVDIAVRGVREGSCIIDFILSAPMILESLPTVLDSALHDMNVAYDKIIDLLINDQYGVIESIIQLQGELPELDNTEAELKLDDFIDIETIKGNIKTTRRILLLITDKEIRKYISDFMSIFWKKRIDKIQFIKPDNKKFEVKKDDAINFQDKRIKKELPKNEQQKKVNFKISSLTFDKPGKWVVIDENREKFKVEIADINFLNKINNNEPFSKGDSLICDIYKSYSHDSEGKIIEKITITYIEDHKRAKRLKPDKKQRKLI